MPDPRAEHDPRPGERPDTKRQTAEQPGGNPDAPPSANAGNVGLGGTEQERAPGSRKP